MINNDSTAYLIEKEQFMSDKCGHCMKYTNEKGDCTNNFCDRLWK